MAITRISRSFKDISLSFEPHPVTKDLPILKNESAIRRSVRNIVETIPTEKFFDSSFGSDVYKSLFDFVDFGTASIIEDQIKTSISNFEPRISVVSLQVFPNFSDNGFSVEMTYIIRGTDDPPIAVEFFLARTR